MKNITLLIFLLFCFMNSANSQSKWTPAFPLENGNKFYIDSVSVTKEDVVVKVRIKEALKKEKINGRMYKNIFRYSLIDFDCNKKRILIRTESYHKQKIPINSKFKFRPILFSDYVVDKTSWKNVEPGTTSHTILEKVCDMFQ